jgi:hypothetical protein
VGLFSHAEHADARKTVIRGACSDYGVSVANIHVVVLGFVLCGGLLFELLRMFF